MCFNSVLYQLEERWRESEFGANGKRKEGRGGAGAGPEKQIPSQGPAWLLVSFCFVIPSISAFTSCLFSWLQDGCCTFGYHPDILSRKERARTYNDLTLKLFLSRKKKMSPKPPADVLLCISGQVWARGRCSGQGRLRGRVTRRRVRCTRHSTCSRARHLPEQKGTSVRREGGWLLGGYEART